MRRVLRVLKWLSLTVIVLIVGFFGWAYYVLQASKPVLTGELIFSSLQAPVEINRDINGIPLLTAENRLDVAFAMGFLHAQERFFQMDLARRVGAGELAELFGSDVLPFDELLRRHRLRHVAEQAVATLPSAHKELLDTYVDGVNAGLQALEHAPLEYTITSTEPEDWTAADSLLVILNMFVLLQDSNGEQEYARHALYQSLPESVAVFLDAGGSGQWDAPITGPTMQIPAIPLADAFSLRDRPIASLIDSRERPSISGSNAWAMSGDYTGSGAAIVANDMHLAYYMPSMFYRMEWVIEPDSNTIDRQHMVGITLPGLPMMVAGSNGFIAWGLTNSAGDWSDTVLLDSVNEEQTGFQAADGRLAFETVVETIDINGSDPASFEIKSTPWGPVYEVEESGDLYAMQWVAHYPRVVNLGLLELEQVHSTAAALQLTADIGIPQQNIIFGDHEGNIGWTIAGAIPDRSSSNGYFPLHSSDLNSSWQRWPYWLSASEYPRIYNPQHGRLWTANARVVGGEDLDKIGHGYYVLGARARQIRDGLFAIDQASEQQMLDIQMDHRALFLQHWAELMQQTIKDAGNNPKLTDLAEQLSAWDGTAAYTSQAYTYIRGFREQVLDHVFTPYVDIIQTNYPTFELEQVGDQQEGPLWTLVSEQPEHLLPAQFDSWQALLVTSLIESVDILSEGEDLKDISWGDSNRLAMRHVMSEFVPFFGALFDMPEVPLHGDRHMPLSQQSGHGPVQRMVVRPGEESSGLMTGPGGQAGNPLTTYYGAGQQDWLDGMPSGLRAGDTVYLLRLVPQ